MARHGRLAAFSLYDFADSAFATVIVTVLYNQYYAGTVAGGPEGVVLLGLRIPGATMFTWLQAFSMALVAVAAPFLGALADRRRSRTGFLALFWFPGVLLTVALAGVEAGEWIEGGLLFATAYICFAASSIFYNALLPEIGPPADLGRLSGIAWGIGYFGGGIVLILDLVLLKKPSLLGLPEGDLGIGACFALAGLWWFVFALPLLWVFRGEFFRSARSPIVAAGSTADGTAPLAKLERSAGGPSHPTGVVAQVRPRSRGWPGCPSCGASSSPTFCTTTRSRRWSGWSRSSRRRNWAFRLSS